MIARTLIVLSAASLLVACGDDTNDAAPELVPGGGVSSGAIAGKLNVYVIDAATDQPVAGASVRVGAAAEAAPLTGTTDGSGLCTFTDGRLSGPQTITATASGHAAATWIGANGANVTIPLDPATPPAVPTATVSGTIAGWDGLPAPASGHYTVALILYSLAPELGAPENSIGQGTPPRNVCLRTALNNNCDWVLQTRTGPQAHYAVILDGDSNGTLATDDDTYATLGYAVRRGLDFTAGQTVTAEQLDLVSPLADVTLAFPTAPAGLDAVAAAPVLDLGAEGLAPLGLPDRTSFPILSPTQPTMSVPAIAGALGDAAYGVLAHARPSTGTTPSSTSIFFRYLVPGQSRTLDPWLPPPTSLSATAGTYAFTGAPGATFHAADFLQSDGRKAWSVAILDGSTSFSLPQLSPDALPAGTLTLRVTAAAVDGLDLGDFSLADLGNTAKRLGVGEIDFTH